MPDKDVSRPTTLLRHETAQTDRGPARRLPWSDLPRQGGGTDRQDARVSTLSPVGVLIEVTCEEAFHFLNRPTKEQPDPQESRALPPVRDGEKFSVLGLGGLFQKRRGSCRNST